MHLHRKRSSFRHETSTKLDSFRSPIEYFNFDKTSMFPPTSQICSLCKILPRAWTGGDTGQVNTRVQREGEDGRGWLRLDQPAFTCLSGCVEAGAGQSNVSKYPHS